MIFFEPHLRDKKMFPYDVFKAVVIPRPIGWVATVSSAGELNLAPYSYFNGVQSWPQIVCFASESPKDSMTFAQETREFTWSMATWPLREQMNQTSAGLPRGQNEFEFAGLKTAPSKIVKPPRVEGSPASLECRVTQILALKDLTGKETGGTVVFGQVVGIHVDERCVKDGKMDAVAMQTIARCGYHEYTIIDRVFTMVRPESAGSAFGGAESKEKAKL